VPLWYRGRGAGRMRPSTFIIWVFIERPIVAGVASSCQCSFFTFSVICWARMNAGAVANFIKSAVSAP
jgi:hypothetical protein